MAGPMPIRMPIHEVKDHLSRVIAELAASGEEVHITKHGHVVARLVPPAPAGVVLGLGGAHRGEVPDVGDLRWTDEDLDAMFGGPAVPE